MIRLMTMSLWNAVWKPLKCASHVSEVGRVAVRDSNIHVYSLYGLGFGSDVTIVVRLDEPTDRTTAGGRVAALYNR